MKHMTGSGATFSVAPGRIGALPQSMRWCHMRLRPAPYAPSPGMSIDRLRKLFRMTTHKAAFRVAAVRVTA